MYLANEKHRQIVTTTKQEREYWFLKIKDIDNVLASSDYLSGF